MAKYGPGGNKGQVIGLAPIRKPHTGKKPPLMSLPKMPSPQNPSRWASAPARIPRAKGPVMKGKVRGPT